METERLCSSPAQPGLTKRAALSTGSSATSSEPLQTSPDARPPHQAPRPSQPSSVLCMPHRKVSTVGPRRDLEGPMPRDLATPVSSRPSGSLPALLRSQAEQTDSFTFVQFPQQPIPTQTPHPTTVSSLARRAHPDPLRPLIPPPCPA